MMVAPGEINLANLAGVAPEHLGLHARMVAMDDPQATANLLEKWIGTDGEQ